jgi:hypothetical protein
MEENGPSELNRGMGSLSPLTLVPGKQIESSLAGFVAILYKRMPEI